MTKTATTKFACLALYCMPLLNNSSGMEFHSRHWHECFQFTVSAPQSTRELFDSYVLKVVVREVQYFQLAGGWADNWGECFRAVLCQVAAPQSKQTENKENEKTTCFELGNWNIFVGLFKKRKETCWVLTWVSPVCSSSVRQRAVLILHLSSCCYPGPAL